VSSSHIGLLYLNDLHSSALIVFRQSSVFIYQARIPGNLYGNKYNMTVRHYLNYVSGHPY